MTQRAERESPTWRGEARRSPGRTPKPPGWGGARRSVAALTVPRASRRPFPGRMAYATDSRLGFERRSSAVASASAAKAGEGAAHDRPDREARVVRRGRGRQGCATGCGPEGVPPPAGPPIVTAMKCASARTGPRGPVAREVVVDLVAPASRGGEDDTGDEDLGCLVPRATNVLLAFVSVLTIVSVGRAVLALGASACAGSTVSSAVQSCRARFRPAAGRGLRWPCTPRSPRPPVRARRRDRAIRIVSFRFLLSRPLHRRGRGGS